jgi:hypothetical protein
MHSSQLLVLALGAAVGSCHFSVTYPSPIHAQDGLEGTEPCGGADIASRANVINWPAEGSPLGWMTTHPTARYHVRAALVNDTNTWKDILPGLNQDAGLGYACLSSVPGVHSWVGADAVVQVHQVSGHGSEYQVREVLRRRKEL